MINRNDASKKRQGQSTIEYIILVAAVIVIGLLVAQQGGVFQRALNATVDTNLNAMMNMADRIFE